MRQFGVSTHLFHGERLTREHLLEIGRHGFEAVELFATRTHFDYHNPASVADLQEWVADAGLRLHGVHAPIGESFANGRWGPPLSLASTDAEARARALQEAEQALYIARRLPFDVLVAHIGLPRTQQATPATNNRDAARRSIEHLLVLAEPLGVRIALEVIPNDLSRPATLVHFIEEVLDEPEVGICLDFGHANMDGDVVDAIETVSEHLVTTHVHDNRGRQDEHLLPFEGTIDWPAALTTVQKVGYDGTLLLEVASHGSARSTLEKARAARAKMESLLQS
ncbi:MAG: sugar phosphate isomerase/epimerase family protein [Vicinamibacterales bacterium]